MFESSTRVEIADVNSLQSRLMTKGVMCDGYGIAPKYMLVDFELSTDAKELLLAVCAFADSKTHQTFVKSKTLAKALQISMNTFYKTRKELIEQGYITIEKESGFGGKTVTTVADKPSKFYREPPTPKLAKKYELIRKYGIFSKQLGYGFIPRSIILDTRAHRYSKLIYGFHGVFAGNGTGFFADMGRVSKAKLQFILHHLQICKSTYYKYFNPLRELNYITTYHPRNNRIHRYSFYVLHARPDVAKATQTDRRLYVEEARTTPKRKQKSSTRKRPKWVEYSENPKVKPTARVDIRDGIPYKIAADRESATAAVRQLTKFDKHVTSVKYADDYERVFITFTEALTDLICDGYAPKSTTTKATYAHVIDRINAKFIGDLEALAVNLIGDYESAASCDTIKYPRAYMKSCIYNALVNH